MLLGPVAGLREDSVGGLCGAGYDVVDRHALGGATVYLAYRAGTGENRVVTLATGVAGAVPTAATLTAQGDAPVTDAGLYTYYAGPVHALAPGACVRWGDTYSGSTWTSDWTHCG